MKTRTIFGLAVAVQAGVVLAMPGAVRLGGQTLAAASCGVRSTLMFEHYAATLYLPRRASVAAELIDAAAPKAFRMRIINSKLMPKDIPAKWRRPLESQLDEGVLERVREAYRALKPGDEVLMTYSPRAGVSLQVNGTPVATARGHGLIETILHAWADDEPLRPKLARVTQKNPCRPGAVAQTVENIAGG